VINSVTLVGRAGGDPEATVFNNGNKVVSISMALKRRVKEQDLTDWVQIKLWGKSADVAQEYIRTGHLFGVVGELRQESWESNGQKRSKLVVNAQTLKLMQPKGDGGSSENTQTNDAPPADDYDPFADDSADAVIGWD